MSDASFFAKGKNPVGGYGGLKADKKDLTSIFESGSTASQAISAGTYFYLNGVLVKAITAIASGATFTEDTNYEVVTAGALNELKGTVLWSQSASTFSASTFSLGDISKYKYFKITTSEGIGECLKGNTVCISSVWYNDGIAGYERGIAIASNGTVTVYDAYAVHNGNTANTRIIPYEIIGYVY